MAYRAVLQSLAPAYTKLLEDSFAHQQSGAAAASAVNYVTFFTPTEERELAKVACVAGHAGLVGRISDAHRTALAIAVDKKLDRLAA